MSDTPRTDAEAVRLDDWGDNMFGPDFARQLERELNEARVCLRETIHVLKKYGYGLLPLASEDIARWRKAAGLNHIADANKMVEGEQ